MTVPQKLLVVSDSNVLEYRSTVETKKKEQIFTYQYVKSETKMGWLFEINEVDLNNYLKNNIFKSIE